MGNERKPEQWTQINSRRPCLIPFWMVVTGGVFMTVSFAVAGMFAPIEMFLIRLGDKTKESCSEAVQGGNDLLAQLVHKEVTYVSYVSLLRSIEFNIQGFVSRPAQSAVGSLWGNMQTEHVFENSWTGNNNSNQRVELMRLTWAGLVGQWSGDGSVSSAGAIANDGRRARTDTVRVGFEDGAEIGAAFTTNQPIFCSGLLCVNSCWQPSTVFISEDSEMVKVAAGSSAVLDCRDECLSFEGCSYWHVFTSTGDCYLMSATNGSETLQDVPVFSGLANCADQEQTEEEDIGATLFSSGEDSYTVWFVDGLSGELSGDPYVGPPKPQANMAEKGWYATQLQLKQKGGPLRPAWSKVRPHNDHLAISWTAPVAYCGDYSCLEGVISSDMLLEGVSHDAFNLWLNVRDILKEEPYKVKVDAEHSGIFIVSHKANNSPEQQGLLIGCSSGCPGAPEITPTMEERMASADNASNRAVRLTSQAILERFGSWDNQSLQEDQLFTFKSSNVREQFEEGSYCGQPLNEASQVEDCWQAGMISVQLDEDTSWLVVLVLPASAFALKSSEVAANALQKEREITLKSADVLDDTRMRSGVIGGIIVVVSVLLGMCLGFHVSSRLTELTVLTQRLSNLNFTEPSELNGDCRIRDVSKLQSAFCSLTRGIEAFARFVPEPVVRSVVHGQAIRLCERNVTILCSDIANFTSIAEEISQTKDGHLDLLFLLTRYLSVMHRVVHAYQGMVAEILGDGLLIYWGAHDDLDVTQQNHPARACAAALEMHNALQLLNYELTQTLRSGTSQPLPSLKIRVGIHSAMVLSGTVGSEMKKKFSCLGQGAAIAEQLESECKRLDVSTLCSWDTYDALRNESWGFRCREVGAIETDDIEHGKMNIYEVQGRDPLPEAGIERLETDLSGPEDEGRMDSMRSISPAAEPMRSRRSNGSQMSFRHQLSMRSNVTYMTRCSTLGGLSTAPLDSARQACVESAMSLRRNASNIFADAEESETTRGYLQQTTGVFDEPGLGTPGSASQGELIV